MRVNQLPKRVAQRSWRMGYAAASQVVPRYRAMSVGAANSLCTRERLAGLQKVAGMVRARGVAGDVIECGVYRGGSAVVIGERLLNDSHKRAMWLFDVFSGMPQPSAHDPAEAWDHLGQYVSSEETVRQTFRAARLPLDRVHIVVGRFEDTLHGFHPSPIAFLHVDCDWYEPVKLCLHRFYDAVVPGGVVVLDDYGCWSGCRKAVDEWLAERSLRVQLTAIDETSHFFVKP